MNTKEDLAGLQGGASDQRLDGLETSRATTDTTNHFRDRVNASPFFVNAQSASIFSRELALEVQKCFYI